MLAMLLVATFLTGASQHGARLPPPKAKPAAAAHKATSKAKSKAQPKSKSQAKPAAQPVVQVAPDVAPRELPAPLLPAPDSPAPELDASGLAAAVDNPLAPAADGRMQCYKPDTVRRTCASFAEYVSNGDGSWSNISSVLINSAPILIMKTITPVTLKDGAICGEIKREDIEAATLSLGGEPMDAEAAAPVLIKVAGAMGQLYGREICTRYHPNGINYTAKVTLDGETGVMPDNEVLWVRPQDGYNVAP